MDQKVIRSARLGEELIKLRHASGLTILLCPMKGYSSVYAAFTANIGSVDVSFKTQDDDAPIDVPAGVAHFLEHKMFEDEDGDAFAKYAKTGASANAFTSFDKTSYLFSCTERFEESLEILLGFVRRPYFTEQSVSKEQGIIGQEIRMYDDSGDWRVMFNLLEALYQKHPVRIDIAGTVESISEITPDLLYRCHRTFYNLNNMVLCVAGGFEVEAVLRVADRMLQADAKLVEIERGQCDEPDAVGQKLVEQKLSVAMPLFQFGFKGHSYGVRGNMEIQVQDELLAELIAGEASPLYRALYDEGLVGDAFDTEVMAGRDYMCVIFSGESRDPHQVADRISREIERLKREGIDRELFELCKRASYGRYIGMYTRPDAVAGLMCAAHFAGIEDIYAFLDLVSSITYEQITERLHAALDPERSALSIVWPSEQADGEESA